mmetsp:Transcript_35726/g.105607  ORF Transcript_35726/g.105607 Transcript_35726/m.105607 type:complete len:230 (+) Transcript_35726:1498-2187(+)
MEVQPLGAQGRARQARARPQGHGEGCGGAGTARHGHQGGGGVGRRRRAHAVAAGDHPGRHVHRGARKVRRVLEAGHYLGRVHGGHQRPQHGAGALGRRGRGRKRRQEAFGGRRAAGRQDTVHPIQAAGDAARDVVLCVGKARQELGAVGPVLLSMPRDAGWGGGGVCMLLGVHTPHLVLQSLCAGGSRHERLSTPVARPQRIALLSSGAPSGIASVLRVLQETLPDTGG